MRSELIKVKSLTQANRAQSYLGKHKIKCSIERVTSPQGGCGFGLRVYGDMEKICKTLSEINISCGRIGKSRR